MINDRPASLVNLLTYSDTEHALLGSRRWFGVNMGFSDEYQILMDILYVVIRYGAKKIVRNFLIKVMKNVRLTLIGSPLCAFQ